MARALHDEVRADGVLAGPRRRRMLWLLCLAALVGGAILVAVIQPAKAVEDGPSQPPTELEAVSATSSTDAWSVGFRDGIGVILHGDGRSWSPVAIPMTGKLFGVSARSSSDAWAVGDSSAPRSHTLQTAILHWDGLTWTRVPSPNPSSFYNQLYGVVAVSPQDAWAVGYSLSRARKFHSLLLHWNGAKWSTVRVPGTQLYAVDAVSSRSAWAVGFGIILHWNGTRWSRQSVRTRDFLQSVPSISLNGVSAVSATNVWSVGQRCANLGTCIPRTEIIHWNGRRWSTVPSPVPSRWANALNGVSARSARNAWAVGAFCKGSKCSPQRTLTVHWNGRRWSTVPSPNPSSSLNLLAGVGMISPTQVSAVGARGAGSSGTDTLQLDWNGTRWSTG